MYCVKLLIVLLVRIKGLLALNPCYIENHIYFNLLWMGFQPYPLRLLGFNISKHIEMVALETNLKVARLLAAKDAKSVARIVTHRVGVPRILTLNPLE